MKFAAIGNRTKWLDRPRNNSDSEISAARFDVSAFLQPVGVVDAGGAAGYSAGSGARLDRVRVRARSGR
jgi:hypothetical protein